MGCGGTRKTSVCYLPFSVRDCCNCKSWPWPFVGMTNCVQAEVFQMQRTELSEVGRSFTDVQLRSHLFLLLAA